MAVTLCSCLNCGGAIRYDIAEKAFACDHCGSKFTLEQMRNVYPEEQNDGVWESVSVIARQTADPSVGRKSETQEQAIHLRTYNCPACGAEVMAGSETLAAAFCTFCRNPVVIAERLVSGDDLPSRIIPFKKTSAEAAEIFLSKLKNKPLLPAAFKAAVKTSGFKSVYVPFKLFDTQCSACVTAECTNTRRWSDGNYEYTKTDTYESRRAGVMDFNGVPADASEKITDEDMQAVEPFETSELTPFSQNYLLGHFAEAPTSKQDSLIAAVSARVRSAAQNELLRTMQGYDSVTLRSGDTSIDRMSSEYVMFPVWMLTAQYKHRDFLFAINGQTGKFDGKLPIDWRRAGVLFVLLSAVVFAAAVLGWEVWLWIAG